MTLTEKLKGRNIILGSGSPRRRQFLKDLGISFTVHKKPITENYPKKLTHKDIPEYLARLKARPHRPTLSPNDLLLTADTIVWLDGQVLHKPRDTKEAFQLLHQLSGKEHRVISSVCLTSTQKSMVVTGETKVFFHTLTDAEIQFYIEHYQPFDKAGGYGIQEWIGKIGIQRIEGSFYTVMGMPVDQVYRALLNF